MRHTTPNLRRYVYTHGERKILAAIDAEIRHAERTGDFTRAAVLADRKIQIDRVIKGEPLRPNATPPAPPQPRHSIRNNNVRRCAAMKG